MKKSYNWCSKTTEAINVIPTRNQLFKEPLNFTLFTVLRNGTKFGTLTGTE